MTWTNISPEWKIFIGLAVVFFVYDQFERYRRRHRQARAQTWPVLMGRISEAVVFQGKRDATLTLRYYYTVPEEPYPIPAEFQKQFLHTPDAERWAELLSGKMIPVRVDPKNPWKSQVWDSELEAIVAANAANAPATG